MYASCLALTALALSLDTGYRPLPTGGVEHLIPIPPHSVEAIRSDRITAGNEPLPRLLPMAEAAGQASAENTAPTVDRDPFLPPPSTPPIDIETMGKAAPRLPWQPPPGDRQPPTPAALTPDPASKPMAKQAAFVQSSPSPSGQPVQKPVSTPLKPSTPVDEPSKPWLPLTLTLVAFFASLGANLYLGWITWDTRRRYRALLESEAIKGASAGRRSPRE